MTLRTNTLGCTGIAAVMQFTGEGNARWGESRERNHGSASGNGKQGEAGFSRAFGGFG